MDAGRKGGKRAPAGLVSPNVALIKSEKLVEVLADDLSGRRGRAQGGAHALGSIGTEKAVAALERAVAEDQGFLEKGAR